VESSSAWLYDEWVWVTVTVVRLCICMTAWVWVRETERIRDLNYLIPTLPHVLCYFLLPSLSKHPLFCSQYILQPVLFKRLVVLIVKGQHAAIFQDGVCWWPLQLISAAGNICRYYRYWCFLRLMSAASVSITGCLQRKIFITFYERLSSIKDICH